MYSINLINQIIAFENREMDNFEEIIEFFSGLVKSGLAWSLQGNYGRMAQGMIEKGFLAEDGMILSYE